MNVIASTDLWFPGQQDPMPGRSSWGGGFPGAADPTWYVVWVDPGRSNDEQAPRQALHVQARP